MLNVEYADFEVRFRSDKLYLSSLSFINYSKDNSMGIYDAFNKCIFTHCGNGHTENHGVCEFHLFNLIGTPEAEFLDVLGTKES